MTEIVMIRHGQASFGTEDYDRLSPLGHQQARWLGEHFAGLGLGFDRIVCGAMRRHRETAAGILEGMGPGGPGNDLVVDPRLNELDYDRLETAFCAENGCQPPASAAEFREMFPAMLRAWAAGRLSGMPEGFAEFESRIRSALTEAMPRRGRTLVVSSGGPVSVTVGWVLGLGMEAISEVLNMTMNASIHRFEMRDGRLSLLQYNAVPHLDHADRAHARTFI